MVDKDIRGAFLKLKSRFSGFILFVLIAIFIILLYGQSPQWLEKLDMGIQDMMYNFRGNLSPGDQIIIVGIDDKALKNVGDWPWRRDRIADLIYSVSLSQPRVVFMDMFLPQDVDEDTSGNTGVLADLIGELDNVIVPIYFNLSEVGLTQSETPSWVLKSALKKDGQEKLSPVSALQIFYPSGKIGLAAQNVGHINLAKDIDKKVRKEPLLISYQNEYYPSVSLQIAKNYLEAGDEQIRIEDQSITMKDIPIPVDKKARMLVNYNGPVKTFTHISAWDVLSDRVDPQILTHKVVMVGLTESNATKIQTPVSAEMTSVERTSNAVENIIHKNFLTPWSFWFDLLVLVLIGVFCAVVLPNVSLLYRLVILTVFFFVVVNLSFILFSSIGVLTKPLYPILEILLFLAATPAVKPQKKRETEKKTFPDHDEKEAVAEVLKTEPRITTKLSIQKPVSEPEVIQKEAKPSTDVINLISQENKTPEKMKTTTLADLGQFGRYKILEPLGKGAMGTVYKGEDPAIDRLIALKTIRLDLLVSEEEIKELKDRLIMEAQAAGRLSHPNIVTIYDVGEEGDLQYIAMEYLDGYTLDKLMKKKTELNYRIVAKLIIQVCDALSYAHQNGIVHRDIKPANIMILEDFNVKVMDFGIARFGATSMTQPGVAVGTPSYISPEQLQGKPADKRADIFSTGVVLYELLTRHKPFRGEDINSLMYCILNEVPIAPSVINDRIPTIFDRIVEKTMAKNPDERYQDASEISDLLKEFVSSFIVTRSFKI
ncbi:MAG: serine/threonine-protein kinase [Candidatus Zixiibacteriota bacterium]